MSRWPLLLLALSTPALAIPGGGPCRTDHGTWAPYTAEHQGVPLRLSAFWGLSLPEPVGEMTGLFVARVLVQDLGWVEPDKPVRVHLADGEVLQLAPTERFQGKKEGPDVMVWSVPVEVSADDVNKLAASPITKVELPVGDAVYPLKVKAKKGAKAQAAAACLVGG